MLIRYHDPTTPMGGRNLYYSMLRIRRRHPDALSDARTAGMVVVRAIEQAGIALVG